MHIVYNGWFWDQPHTGSGQVVRHLIEALRRIAPEHRLTLVLPGDQDAEDLPDGVDAVSVGGGRGKLAKVWFEQRLFPAAAARLKPDLIHVPYWGAPLSSPAPLITSVLDVVALAICDYADNFRARLYTSLATASARGSAHVLTLSEFSKSEIIKHIGIPQEAITVTHLAADDAYHPRIGTERDAAVRQKYDLPDAFALYLGGFDIRKRVDQLLLAYAYVGPAEGENYPLVIAGREPNYDGRMFPDLRAYAERLQITPYVRWIGAVDEVDKPSLYRLARVFVFPSAYEGFGLPVIEALASGTPVVAQDIPVMREIGGDALFLTEEGNARAMAGAILALLGQEPLREQQIQRGLGQATRFRWGKTARETLAVYEQVIKR